MVHALRKTRLTVSHLILLKLRSVNVLLCFNLNSIELSPLVLGNYLSNYVNYTQSGCYVTQSALK